MVRKKYERHSKIIYGKGMIIDKRNPGSFIKNVIDKKHVFHQSCCASQHAKMKMTYTLTRVHGRNVRWTNPKEMAASIGNKSGNTLIGNGVLHSCLR